MIANKKKNNWNFSALSILNLHSHIVSIFATSCFVFGKYRVCPGLTFGKRCGTCKYLPMPAIIGKIGLDSKAHWIPLTGKREILLSLTSSGIAPVLHDQQHSHILGYSPTFRGPHLFGRTSPCRPRLPRFSRSPADAIYIALTPSFRIEINCRTTIRTRVIR